MYNLLSKGIQSGVKFAVKQITLTATQKTAATIGSKVAIGVATTAASTAINNHIQDKQLKKNVELAADEAEKLAAGEITEEDLTSEDEFVKLQKKSRAKGAVASGVVIGVGSVAMTAVDCALKAI